MSTNDTLMDECRKEAEAIYYTMPWEKEEDRALFEELNAIAIREREAYAAALYTERSKPRTGLTVDEVMEVVAKWDIDTLYWNDNAKAKRELRARLAAKINSHGPTR